MTDPHSTDTLIDGCFLSIEQGFAWCGAGGFVTDLPPALRALIRTLAQRDRLALPINQDVATNRRREARLFAAETALDRGEPVITTDGQTLTPAEIAWLREAWPRFNLDYGVGVRLLDRLPPAPEESDTYHLRVLWTDPVTGRKAWGSDTLHIGPEATDAEGVEMATMLCEVLDLSLERLRKESPCPA